MRPALVLAVSLLLVPVCVITSAAALMKSCSDYAEVQKQLAAASNGRDGQALYARVGGYAAADVAAHWGLLNHAGRVIERRFLRADMVYPLCYGGLLATAILVGRRRAGRPIASPAAGAPVVTAVLADWTENLVQLRQLDLFEHGGATALDPSWIAVASAATSLKWASLVTCAVLLVWLAWRIAFGEDGRGERGLTSDSRKL